MEVLASLQKESSLTRWLRLLACALSFSTSPDANKYKKQRKNLQRFQRDKGFVERDKRFEEGWRSITLKKERHEVVFSKSFYHQYLKESLVRIKKKTQWVQEILLFLINNNPEVKKKNRFSGLGFLIFFFWVLFLFAFLFHFLWFERLFVVFMSERLFLCGFGSALGLIMVFDMV